jgi:hypothetical protein
VAGAASRREEVRGGWGKMLQTVKDACKFDPNAIDYVLSDQIENLDYLVGHDPKAAEAFFGNAPPHRPSSTSYFSTIEFLCWRFQSTLGSYARMF